MKNLSASLSTCLQTLLPKNHVALHLFWGLCLSLSHLLPHPDWLSKDTLLVIQGVCVVLLCILPAYGGLWAIPCPVYSSWPFPASTGWLSIVRLFLKS